MQHQRNPLGQHAAVQVNQQGVAQRLFLDPPLRVGGDLHEEPIRYFLIREGDLKQAVRQLAGLHDLRLHGPPGAEAGHAGQAEQAVAVVVDHPLAAAVLVVAHESPSPPRVRIVAGAAQAAHQPEIVAWNRMKPRCRDGRSAAPA